MGSEDTSPEGNGDIEGPIKIGALGPTDDAFGTSIVNSAELAAEQLNEEGGIAGANVEIIPKDTKNDPQTAKTVYQELTTGENVDATVGVFSSENMIALMPAIAQKQTPHLTAGSATPEAARMVHDDYERLKYWFRLGPVNSHYLGKNMVEFTNANFDSLGWDSVAVLAEDYKWTEPISKALEGSLSETGIDVAVNKRYSKDTKDFTPIFDDIENAGVDVAYTVMAHTGTAALLQWRKQQRPFEFGGIHVPMQLPSYYEAVKGAARYGFTQNTATPTTELTDKTVPFNEAYNEKYDGYPVYNGYMAFDGVKMFANAVESVGSLNADDLVSEIEGMSYTGTAGTVEFYGTDHEFTHDVKYDRDKAYPLWLQWQKDGESGAQKALWPDEFAETEYKKPPWV